MSTTPYKRQFKFFVFKLKLHRLIPAEKLRYFAYYLKLSHFVNNTPVLQSSDFYTNKYDYTRRFNNFNGIISNELNNKPVNYLEFGVASGASIKWWVENYANPDSMFIGYDTFEGLPEDWSTEFKKGYFDQKGKFPEVNDSRCSFRKGVFQHSLRDSLSDIDFSKQLVLHLDADLYSSTLFVLTTLAPYFKPGDIILFDEFGGPIDEFKAWLDFCAAYYLKYEVLSAQNNFFQLSLKITEINYK